MLFCQDRLQERAGLPATRPGELRDPLQTPVVGADVEVEHLLRITACVLDLAQEIEHQIGVEHALRSAPGEAITVVVPLHRVDQRRAIRDARIRHEMRLAGEELVRGALHLRAGEAGHRAELILLGDVADDVEAAREVVEHDGRHARHEHPAQRPGAGSGLEGRVEAADEPGAPDDGLVERLIAVGQQAIGEVVVFVDDEIQLVLGAGDDGEHRSKEPGSVVVGVERVFQPREARNTRSVPHEEGAHAVLHRRREAPADVGGVTVGVHGREIEREDEVLAPLGGGVIVNPEAAEELVELGGTMEVVVVLQHAEQRRLAEAAGTQEDQVSKPCLGALELGEKGSLVRVEVATTPDVGEVGGAVGDSHAGLERPRTYHRSARTTCFWLEFWSREVRNGGPP